MATPYCRSICASNTELVCDLPEGHTGDHRMTLPTGETEWPEGWGVTVGVPEGQAPLPDPNAP